MTHTASVHQHGTDPKGQPLPGKPISAARRAGTPALHDVSNPVRAIPNNLYLCQGTQQPFRTGPPPPHRGTPGPSNFTKLAGRLVRPSSSTALAVVMTHRRTPRRRRTVAGTAPVGLRVVTGVVDGTLSVSLGSMCGCSRCAQHWRMHPLPTSKRMLAHKVIRHDASERWQTHHAMHT